MCFWLKQLKKVAQIFFLQKILFLKNQCGESIVKGINLACPNVLIIILLFIIKATIYVRPNSCSDRWTRCMHAWTENNLIMKITNENNPLLLIMFIESIDTSCVFCFCCVFYLESVNFIQKNVQETSRSYSPNTMCLKVHQSCVLKKGLARTVKQSSQIKTNK